MQVDLPSSPQRSSAAMPTFSQLAINVKNVDLTYGKKIPVLKDLCLEAPRGSIYGLLGPSGCGKTSLIRCILGMLKVTSGSIQVFGHKPGSSHPNVPGAGVGYMPQEISLFSDLTIEETLNYFGALYGMNASERAERCQFLVQFLELPETNRLVGVLSGGQKRRVSLATALIHKPPLLILDEPTVGVDPLLRKSIWEHLIELSLHDHLTVLITTHYIEEAKDAHLVGLMRYGHILAQDRPAQLLIRFSSATLESVFLTLCTQDEAQEQENTIENFVRSSSRINSISSSGVDSLAEVVVANAVEDQAIVPSESQQSLKMSAISPVSVSGSCQIMAMATKNIRSLWRNKGLMLFQLGLPTIEVILFCLCIGLKMHSIPVAVYDGDQSDLTFQLLNALNPDIIKLTNYPSVEKAVNAVRRGKASTALAMYDNFSDCFFERMFMLGDVNSTVMYNSTIHLHPDMSNQLMAMAVHEEMIRAFLKVSKSFLVKHGISPNMLQMPVLIEEPIYGNKDPSFTEFMAPGVIASIAFLAAIPLTAMALVVENKNGLIERARVAGVSHFRILLSHLMPQTIILLMQVLPLMLIVFPFFGIPYHGEFFLILALTYLQSICGMSFGLFVSTIARDENTATMLALGFFYPNLLLSGTVWPTEAMNTYVRNIAYFLPQTLPILSLRHMITRGWSLYQPEVVCGFVVTFFWICVFLLASTVMARFRK